jgi:hypothetical protein
MKEKECEILVNGYGTMASNALIRIRKLLFSPPVLLSAPLKIPKYS